MMSDYNTKDLKGYDRGDFISVNIFITRSCIPRSEEHLVDINQEILDQLNELWKQHTDKK